MRRNEKKQLKKFAYLNIKMLLTVVMLVTPFVALTLVAQANEQDFIPFDEAVVVEESSLGRNDIKGVDEPIFIEENTHFVSDEERFTLNEVDEAGEKELEYPLARSREGWHWNGSGYYFYVQGQIQTGLRTINGHRFFLDPARSGRMARGWAQIGNTWRFFNEGNAQGRGGGQMRTGWLQRGNNWYFLHNTTGIMQTGWQNIGSHTFFFHLSGRMATGWLQTSNGHWFYLNPTPGAAQGRMVTGWLELGTNVWYHFGTVTSTFGFGRMYTGVRAINGVLHHFNNNGVWLGRH